MNRAPERYTDTQVLSTYAETKNITVYCQGPIGIQPFEPFFENVGTRTTLAFVKPHHWAHICQEYTHHTHILVLRDPIQAHKHASFLHGMSMHEGTRKRDNMFYSTHLRPHLGLVKDAEFDFYIPFERLSKYLLQYEMPAPPIMDTSLLFDVSSEVESYKYIKDNKMELTLPQWRELLMRGQLEEI